MVTGRTLQEEIAATTRQLLLRGRNILGSLSPPTSSIPLQI
jgi:pyruvate/oxaloacetate carboxyltransferase